MSAQTTAINDAPEDDPWATGTGEEPFAEEAAAGPDEFDFLLEGLSEEETDEAIHVPSSARTYRNPYDVNLKHLQWVPITIEEIKVDPKFTHPRFPARVCVAELDGKKYLLADQVEEALAKGGTESVRDDIPMPYFVATANHTSSEIQRSFPWEVMLPVFKVKTALAQPRGAKTGYPNESGRAMRLATGATKTGEAVSTANMHEIAARMKGKTVLAQLNIVQSSRVKYRAVLDGKNQPIRVRQDPETGATVLLLKLEDGSGYVYDNPTGEIWEGDEKTLVPAPGLEQRYAILDSGENSGQLQEAFYPVTDYLKDTFLPLPERKVTVSTLSEGQVEGEITLDTIGAIAQAPNAGVNVDVFLKSGRKVTAVWIGTMWQEVQSEDGGLNEFASNSDPVDAL